MWKTGCSVSIIGTLFSYVASASEGDFSLFKRSSSDASSMPQVENPSWFKNNKRGGFIFSYIIYPNLKLVFTTVT